MLRFVGVSALLHVMAAPATYVVWRDVVHSGRLSTGRAPLWVWPLLVGYVALPIALGSLVGTGANRGWHWVESVTGPDPAPRAWDYLFGQRPDGWLRLRLKSGRWLAGAYATEGKGWRSYASGYPEAQDLFLVEAAEVDPETGEFLFDEDDQPLLRGSGILIRWEEIEYLEFVDV
jgi:hypothetical protein